MIFYIIYFLGFSLALGIVVGCLIYLFFEDYIEKDKNPKQTMAQVLKDLENRSLQTDIDDEMADLRRRLGGK